ncbi:hypothetical protein RRG08_067256 [Elysia crispata]|uniref:Uncharacterized protein n=1 Tax=Elysia crispata TaxID=231223 RepID=A0AAE1ACC1_9GAST|nr:hypothetical protein RRG08_067256 [Elysia crispata]
MSDPSDSREFSWEVYNILSSVYRLNLSLNSFPPSLTKACLDYNSYRIDYRRVIRQIPGNSHRKFTTFCHRCTGHSTTLQVFRVPKKRSVSHKFNNFPLVVGHVRSTRHKERAMQQITARDVSSRLCHAVYGSATLNYCVQFSLARLRCAMCRVPSMEGPPKVTRFSTLHDID